MADLETTIRAVFKAEIGPLTKALDSMQSKLNAAERATHSLGRALGTLKNIAIGGGVAYLLKGLVGIAAQTETTQIGIATLLQSADKAAGVGTTFAGAMAVAGNTLAALRKEAVETPGTFQQVAAAFQVVAMQGRMAGASVKDLTHLAGNMATLDTMLFQGKGVVARDVQQLLRGEAGDIATPQLAAQKLQLAALARRNQAQALSRISGLLEVDPEARKASGKSFDGMLSSAKDKLSQIAEIAGRPLMNRLNAGLEKALGWLDKNQARVEQIASAIGTGLADAVTFVGKAIAWLADNPMVAAAGGAALILGKFGLLGSVLTGLATNPFFAAVAAAGAIIGSIVDYMNATPEDKAYRQSVADANFLDHVPGGGILKSWATALVPKEDVAAFDAANGVNVAKKSFAFVDAVAKKANQQAVSGVAGVAGGALGRSVLGHLGKAGRTTQKNLPINIDARNARINVTQHIEKTDPGELAGAALISSFRHLTNRVIRPEGMTAPTGRAR